MFEGQPKGFIRISSRQYRRTLWLLHHACYFHSFPASEIRLYSRHDVNNLCQFPGRSVFHAAYRRYPADKFGYGKMVTTGIVIMFAGYVLLAIPMATNIGLYSMFGALALIALNRTFKGNLQVMVGNLMMLPEYSAKRDTAFSLFSYGNQHRCPVRSDCRYC